MTTSPGSTQAALDEQLDREIFDTEEEIAAAALLAPLLRDWNGLVRAEIGSVQSYAVCDRMAQIQQRWHQCLVAIAAIAGSAAVLLAVLQLAAFARPALRNSLVVDVLSHSEYVAAVLAVVAVFLGLTAAFHNRWRVLRMKAEQYRFLKFHFLLHAAKWLPRSSAERLEYLRTMLAGIHALDDEDGHHWAQGVFSLLHDEPASIAAADAAIAGELVAYFRDKRIGSQANYFRRQAARRHGHERSTWFIPPACFFLSIVFAFVHFAVEIGEHQHESSQRHSAGTSPGASGKGTTSGHRHDHVPSPLMIACLLGAAAFPVLGAMVRTIRTAFEFGRNANRFEGVAHTLAEIERELASPRPPVAQMELLRDAERVLQYENRSWMRLMIEAEWFG